MQRDSGKNCKGMIDKRLVISIVAFAALAMMVLAVVSVDDSNSVGQNEIQKSIDKYSGTCGDGVTFTFNEATGKLTIVKSGHGSGAMVDENPPWERYCKKIKEVVIGEGVTHVGALNDCVSLNAVTIPTSVETIGKFAFQGCTSLKSVDIPCNVKTVDDFAFEDCTSLESVGLSRGTKHICEGAFKNCISLRSIDIPNTVETLEIDAFKNCTSLCDINVGYSIKKIGSAFPNHRFKMYDGTPVEPLDKNFPGHRYIGETKEMVAQDETGKCGDGVEYRFLYSTGELTISRYGGKGCMGWYGSADAVPWNALRSQIKSVNICEGVLSIADYAFTECILLKNITIPESVKCIGDNAFEKCTSLESVELPKNIKVICMFAFSGCTSLKSIAIPGSVEYIGSNAFKDCTSLESIAIPGSVKYIGSNAFKDCTKLTDVTFMEGIRDISRGIFTGCTSLKSIAIPGSVESIGSNAFKDCTSLESIAIPGSVKYIGSNTFEDCTKLTDVTFMEGIRDIPCGIFTGCTSLKCVDIPSTVKSIGNDAFIGCKALDKIRIPNGVESIGNGAFSGCESLKSIEIPGTVTSLKSNAFKGCTSLCYVNIKFGTEGIAADAFPDHKFQMHDGMPIAPNDRNFPWHEYRGETTDKMVVLNESGWCGIRTAFYFIYSTGEMRIDSRGGFREMYDFTIGTRPWESVKELIKSVKIVDIENVGNYAFAGCKSLVSVEMSCNDAVSIGKKSFDDCRSLKYVKLPDSIKTIGEFAFRYCESLTQINLDSVTSVGTAAFMDCKHLESVTMPNMKSVGDFAFYNCSALDRISIPNGVESIGKCAFEGCTSLKSITIPDRVEYVGSDAFKGCTSLRDINVGYGVKGIAADAFPDHKFQMHDGTPVAPNDKNFPYHEYKGEKTDKMVAQNESGWCGDRVSFYFDYSTGEMRIDSHGGSRVMYDFERDSRPWEPIKDLVKSVKIVGIKNIGSYAFTDCKSLASVEILCDDAVSIGKNSFDGCKLLRQISLPDGITSIGDDAFIECIRLESVIIPKSVKSIGNGAFSLCYNLKSIVIPDGCTVGSIAFNGCVELKEITVGKNAKASSDAFPNHKFILNGIEISPDNQHFAGHTYRGDTVDKMIAAEPVDSESLNVCSAADCFNQSRFFCPIRSA